MVGGASPAYPALARHVVLLVGSRGTSCSGVAIARDLILTAAHCRCRAPNTSLSSSMPPTSRDLRILQASWCIRNSL